MPRLSSSTVPSYRLHKPSGRAVVSLGGRDFYLGTHGSPESQAEYNRLIAAWIANGRRLPTDAGQTLYISELVETYWKYAKGYYRKDGQMTSETAAIRVALRPLNQLYGQTPAGQFGPLALKAIRETFVAQGLCRYTVNKHVERIKRMFRWATENEMVPLDCYHGLQAVTGLRQGRCTARESEPVRPVPDELVDAVIARLSPSLAELIRMQEQVDANPLLARQLEGEIRRLAAKVASESTVAAMIQVQRLTGMRSGELVILRTGDIDMTDRLWIYTPARHKTEHHGRSRVIPLGPRAQEILRPFLKTDLLAYVFAPSEAMLVRRKRRRAARISHVQPSQVDRSHPHARRRPGNRYDTNGYRHAVAYACDATWPLPKELRRAKDETAEQYQKRLDEGLKAKIRSWRTEHRWHPHQLRHNCATRIRKQFGLEVARALLGHTSAVVTEWYAEMDLAKAAEVMAKVG